jgi:putative DNA primase/helicase
VKEQPSFPDHIEERGAELQAFHASVFSSDNPETKPNGKTAAQTETYSPLDLDDEQVLTKASNAANGAKFRALFYEGDFSNYPSLPTQSEADLALCEMLAFWLGKDHSRIDRLFRRSALMRSKWDEKHYSDGRTYGQGTIDKAISNTTETYSPNHEKKLKLTRAKAFMITRRTATHPPRNRQSLPFT